MDAKVTLSFEQEVIQKAKQYANKNGISLSRLVEHLLRKVTTGHYASLEDYPVSDWVQQVAEGQVEYKTKAKSRKQMKDAYYENKKK